MVNSFLRFGRHLGQDLVHDPELLRLPRAEEFVPVGLLLDPVNLGIADALAQLSSGDVVVLASCLPYTRVTVDSARAAARHGLVVVGLTDSVSSPLAAWARHSLYVPDDTAYYSNSMCAFTFVAETLMTLVAHRLGKAGLEALRHREALIRETNTEL